MAKKWKRIVDNKMHSYGEWDDDKMTIKVNKKRHHSKTAKRETPKADGDESLLATIWHEEQHRLKPKATEKQIRKGEKGLAKRLTPQQKQKLYKLYG